jgi:hypothetical protein
VDLRISATAIRVFRGFRGTALQNDPFLQVVGQTFMPGTPYMLRSGGLASYISGILPTPPRPDVPEEFALIGYASAARWNQTMNQTLQGRMYNQTHGGVYDMSRSGANFPEPLDTIAPSDPNPFYTWGEMADWQEGTVSVYFGDAGTRPTGEAFRSATRTAIASLKQGERDCLVCSPGDSSFIVWTHDPKSGAAAPDWTPLQAMSTPLLDLKTTAQRILWRDDEPPLQTFTTAKVMNWIFVREARFFLE